MSRLLPLFAPRAARALLAVLALVAWWAPAAHAETFTCTTVNTVPITLAAPGHYCLDHDLTLTTANSYAIQLYTSEAVLDCNGHSLLASATNTAAAILIAPNFDNNIIRNCVIDGYYVGILAQGTNDPGAAGNRVVDNTIVRSRVLGIQMYGSHNLVARNKVTQSSGNYAGVAKGIVLGSSDGDSAGNVIRDNVIGDFKPTPPTGVTPTVSGIEFNGLRNTVIEGNTISGLYGNSGSSILAIVAYNASGSLISNNVILSPSPLPPPLNSTPGTGIYMNGTPEEQATNTCRDNIIGHFTTDMIGCVVSAANTAF